MKQFQNKKGFTLIELIIVIAIIAILAAGIFVALDPARRLSDARNSSRWQAVNAVLDAAKLYQADNDGDLIAGIDTTLKMIGTDVTGCNVTCGGTAGTPTTITSQIIQNTDDAEERNPPNGTISRNSTDLELVNDGATDQEVGMRFQGITIPQGSIITNAYIQFTVDELNSGATSVIFYGEDIANSPTFQNTAGNITNRTKTTANTSWSNIPAWVSVGATHDTPDLTNIIQEIIDIPTWASGNSLSIIVDGTGERTAESYNGSPAQSPILSITYLTGGTGETTATACVDLTASIQLYLPKIPQDPKGGSAGKTYYGIKDEGLGAISVTACNAESNKTIKAQR